MILFHGGTHIIEHPVVITGDQGRDFGFAFYATDIRGQAERWARRRARYRSRMAGHEIKGIVCEYEFDKDACGDGEELGAGSKVAPVLLLDAGLGSRSDVCCVGVLRFAKFVHVQRPFVFRLSGRAYGIRKLVRCRHRI